MSGNFSVSTFKGRVDTLAGFSKGIFFECKITPINTDVDVIPSIGTGTAPARPFIATCKSVTLPPEVIDTSTVKYFTRELRLPGSRQYAPLTISFYNTINYDLRGSFQQWMDLWNTPEANRRGKTEPKIVNQEGAQSSLTGKNYSAYSAAGKQTDFLATVEIIAYDNRSIRIGTVTHDSTTLASYKFLNAFPTSISGLQYSHEDESFQTFDVEFQYTRMEFGVK